MFQVSFIHLGLFSNVRLFGFNRMAMSSAHVLYSILKLLIAFRANELICTLTVQQEAIYPSMQWSRDTEIKPASFGSSLLDLHFDTFLAPSSAQWPFLPT